MTGREQFNLSSLCIEEHEPQKVWVLVVPDGTYVSGYHDWLNWVVAFENPDHAQLFADSGRCHTDDARPKQVVLLDLLNGLRDVPPDPIGTKVGGICYPISGERVRL